MRANKRDKKGKRGQNKLRKRGHTVKNRKRNDRGFAPRARRVAASAGTRAGNSSNYTALLMDPVAADPCQIPDGYHAETAAIKLVSAGLIFSVDGSGSSMIMVDSHGFGQGQLPTCLLPSTTNEHASFTASSIAKTQQPYDIPFMWQMSGLAVRQTTNYENTGYNTGDARESLPNAVSWVVKNPDSTSGSPGSFLVPQVFPGLDEFHRLYNQARFVCGAVEFRYMGPHGNDQRGTMFVNTSQIGFPADGHSHFETLASLISHPDTVTFPVGTSVTIPLYPSSVVGEGFVHLENYQSVVAVNPNTVGELQWSSTVPSSVFTQGTGAVSSGAPAQGPWFIDGGASAVVTAAPVANAAAIPYGTGVGVIIDGNFQPENDSSQDVARGLAGGVLNQLPTMYAAIVGGPTGSLSAATAMYMVKVVFNVEAIVRPEVANIVGSTSVPSSPAAIARGRSLMNHLGDIASRFGTSFLSVAAPFATDLGARLGGAAAQAVFRVR
jgi:hypothetical protein